nr:hypothetical protein [Clostridium thermarum]
MKSIKLKNCCLKTLKVIEHWRLILAPAPTSMATTAPAKPLYI